MIDQSYVGHIQSTRFAAIEAFIEINGHLNSTDLSKLFGMHRCNTAKIINKYIVNVSQELSYSPTDKRYVPSTEFTRKVLLPDTNAVAYLRVLHAIHGLSYEVS